MKTRARRLVPAALALALVAGACGDDGSTESTAPATTAAAAGAAASGGSTSAVGSYTTPLKGDCPSPLIVQKDWLNEIEHAALYQLIGPGGKMSENQYTGPLGTTGIDLKIIDGGPGLGEGQSPLAALYAGNLKFNITPHMAFVSTDDLAIFSQQFPAVAVVTPLDKSPQMLFWDPATYPNGFKSIDDLKKFATTGNKIYVNTIKRTYGKYLVDQGVPESAFLEGYAGDAEKFVTNGGKWLNQGFASNEVWSYENGRGWAKPVKYVYVSDLGYDFYPSSISVAKNKLPELSNCLKKLVPLIQQAQVDYMANPGPVNKLIFDYNEGKFGAGFWKTPLELNEAGHKVLKNDGLVSNGSDSTLGNFDLTRVQKTIDLLKPGLDERAKKDLKPADLVTNDFVDKSIGLK